MIEAPNKPSVYSCVQKGKAASLKLLRLTAEQRTAALFEWAKILKESVVYLISENQKDLQDGIQNQVSAPLVGRLKLDLAKIATLERGIEDLGKLIDPLSRSMSRLKLDDGLVLEQVSCPLGLVAVVFESRPDVIPQILSLCLRSGNAVLLKGGAEARNSNLAFMKLVDLLNLRCPFLPPGWAHYFETREEFRELLKYHELISLVVPRGSNELVQSVMAATQIPVLGHADGVCHIYIHEDADLTEALKIVTDAKVSYPAACNAVETVLIHRAISKNFLNDLSQVAQKEGLTLKGCHETCSRIPSATPLGPTDWHFEYGDLTLAVKVVGGIDEAIEHINIYGSHHTDAILSRTQGPIEIFMTSVDSACVFANCSTRFSDGYRFGKGAEVGISTSKLHARGPVGVEGLVTYQYRLSGQGHLVATYTGPTARPFKHEPL